MSELVEHNKRAIAALFLMLFIGYCASITLFPHTHIIDGHTVTHSHPYSGTTDGPGHSHSSSQLLVITQLSTLIVLVFALGYLMQPYRVAQILSTLSNTKRSGAEQYRIFSLRGPPSC